MDGALLARGVRALSRVDADLARPTPDELEALAESWRPWRSVAARLLWGH